MQSPSLVPTLGMFSLQELCGHFTHLWDYEKAGMTYTLALCPSFVGPKDGQGYGVTLIWSSLGGSQIYKHTISHIAHFLGYKMARQCRHLRCVPTL